MEFDDQRRETVTAPDGRWAIKLAPLSASATPRTLLIQGSNEPRFDDVLVGEVWLCSGQSNMEKQLGPRSGQQPTDNYTTEIGNAQHPLLRLYQVPRLGQPQAGDRTLQRQICTPETITQPPFSAAAYFFGRELQSKLGVPVGLIHASYGGDFGAEPQRMNTDAFAARFRPS